MGSNQKRSNQKRAQARRAANSPSRSTRPSTARTGAGRVTARQTPKPARGRSSRPSVADAKAYAMAPYADRPAKARGRDARKAERERKKQQLMIPGAPAIIRGGWPGFLVLFLGDGANVLLFGGNGFVLMWIAVIAYAVAGNRAATVSLANTPRAVRDGALAAAMAFGITVPLQFVTGKALQFGVWALVGQFAAAFIIGGLAAFIVARARRKTAAAGS